MSSTDASSNESGDVVRLSNESVSSAASNEYEIVNPAEEADFKIAGNGNESDLKENLKECLAETAPQPQPTPEAATTITSSVDVDTEEEREDSFAEISSAVLVNENIDAHTIFHNVTLLGSRNIKEPKNEQLIHSLMREMNVLDDLMGEDSDGSPPSSLDIRLLVPRTSDGWVYVCDANNVTVAKFPIYRIIFFARGNATSSEAACFAFTCAVLGQEKDLQSPTTGRASYECHIFRCQVPEAVTKVFVSFAQAFRKPILSGEPGGGSEEESFLFEVSLEIRENLRGGSSGDKDVGFEVVPRQKGVFKLRCNVEKKVVVSVQQVSRNSCRLGVERCFGMLVSPGRNVRHADMQLLEHVTMATMSSQSDTADSAYETNVIHVISGLWDPRETAFSTVLNKETPTEVSSVYLTIAADLVRNLLEQMS